VEIPKASGGTRPLVQAVMQVLQAQWDTTFSEHSFGFAEALGTSGGGLKRPPKPPDRVYPLAKNQEYARVHDWEDRST
jgi:hypothetical protein